MRSDKGPGESVPSQDFRGHTPVQSLKVDSPFWGFGDLRFYLLQINNIHIKNCTKNYFRSKSKNFLPPLNTLFTLCDDHLPIHWSRSRISFSKAAVSQLNSFREFTFEPGNKKKCHFTANIILNIKCTKYWGLGDYQILKVSNTWSWMQDAW